MGKNQPQDERDFQILELVIKLILGMQFYQHSKKIIAENYPNVFCFLEKRKTFVKFAATGMTASLFEILTLYVLTDFFHIWYLFSALVAFFFSFFFSFSMHRLWTFRCCDKRYWHQALAYLTLLFGNLIMNLVLLYILVERFNLWYLFAQALILASLGIINFLCNRIVIFKH